MYSSKINLNPYAVPSKPEYIIFSDLDETFYSHNATNRESLNISNFERYLELIVEKKQVLFGIVTGSSLVSVIKKFEEGGFRFLPHFIACDLGTLLYWVQPHGDMKLDVEWLNRLKTSNFSDETVQKIIQILRKNHHINLIQQTQYGASLYKKNYYYYMNEKTKDYQNLECIRKVATEYRVACNINACNPLAGDPENAYDVDFIPLHTGKAAIVKFLMERFLIKKEHTIAFGDSGNDIEMLNEVGNGYLLQNATIEAKSLYKQVAPYPYTKGMLSILQQKLK